MNRRRRFSGPKVARIEKWWAPNTTEPQQDPVSLGTGSPVNAILIKKAFYDTSNDGGSAIARGLGGKLWRFDGFLKLFMDPTSSDTGSSLLNMTRIMYVWLKLKVDANSYTGATLGGATDFAAVLDWPNLMRRDDILRWGSVDVYGPTPDAQSSFPVATQMPTGGFAHTNYTGDVLANKRSYSVRGDAHIPFPRVPKAGLNMKVGEELALFCQAYNLTDTLNTSGVREVFMLPRFRMLFSR